MNLLVTLEGREEYLESNIIVYLGFLRETEVPISNVEPKNSLLGYKLVSCFECEGTGIFTGMEEEICVNCKGTGKVYINV